MINYYSSYHWHERWGTISSIHQHGSTIPPSDTNNGALFFLLLTPRISYFSSYYWPHWWSTISFITDTNDGASAPNNDKATAMFFEEMVTMVQILERRDYDGRLANFPKPNTRKDRIMQKVGESLYSKHDVQRSKEQLRKRGSDLKLREHEHLHRIHKIIKKSN